MRFIALFIFMTIAAAPVFAQELDKADYKILVIGKITLEDVSTDVTGASINCYTYMYPSSDITDNNYNDTDKWLRTGHNDYVVMYKNGKDSRKKTVLTQQKVSMFRQKDATSANDKSYYCRIKLHSDGKPSSSYAGEPVPSWSKGTGMYIAKGDFY